MTHLKIAIKQLRTGKVIAALAIIVLTVAVALMNINLSVVRKFITVPMIASKLDDRNLYALSVNHAFYESLCNSLSAEEAERYLQGLENGYCAEQGLSSLEDSPFSEEELSYDMYFRYDLEHPEQSNPLYPQYTPGLWEARELCPCISDIWCIYWQQFVGQLLQKNGHCLICSDALYIDAPLLSRMDYHLLCGRKPAEGSDSEALLEVSGATEKSNSKAFLGESVEMRYYNFEKKQYEARTVTIVGVTDSPHYQFGVGNMFDSSSTNLGILFRREMLEQPGIAGTDCCGKLVLYTPAGYDGDAYMSGPTSISYIRVKKGTSDADIQSMRQTLLDRHFESMNLHEAYQQTLKEDLKLIGKDASIIVVSALLSLVLIVVVIRWQIGRSRKQQYVFMLAGASKKDQRRIVEWYLLLLHLLAMISSGLFLYFWMKHLHAAERDLFGIVIDRQNVVLMLILLAASYLVGRLTVRISFAKYSQTGMMQT